MSRLRTALVILAAGLHPVPLFAADDPPGHITISAEAAGRTRPVTLDANTSLILDLPEDVSEVIVSKPEVANAVLRTKRRAIIQAVAGGATNIFFLAADGRTLSLLDIRVNNGAPAIVDALKAAYAEVLPGAAIEVSAVATAGQDGETVTRVVLAGSAPTADDAAKAAAIAAQFTGAPENVANIITVSGPQQVTLKVTVAEINRQVARTLGIDINAAIEAGGLTTKLVTSLPTGGISNLAGNTFASLQRGTGEEASKTVLRALEQQRAVRTLAEPTLTAISGQPADFVAGGQFAVPTNIDNGQVSYSYKDFGLKLSFTPTIRSGGDIALTIDTSMSELSAEGSISVGNASLPGIKNRQAKTSVELKPGETLAIGGLIQESTRAEMSRLPGVGAIPVLGELFTSRDYIRAETELVVMVTPYLATTEQADAMALDDAAITGDSKAQFLARLGALYGRGTAPSAATAYAGDVGFLLE